MWEVYVRCPTTGEPVYAGFQLTEIAATRPILEHSICPACGGEHDWQAATVWSAIPVTLPVYEMPLSEAPSLAIEGPPRASPALNEPYEPAWPKVA